LKLLFWRIDAVIGSVHLITHRNKPENYFLGLLDIKDVLLIPILPYINLLRTPVSRL
jgi:hypothetical protein